MPELVRRLISGPSEADLDKLFRSGDPFFWVDWREEDEKIVEYCGSILGSGSLSCRWHDDDLIVVRGSRSVPAQLTESEEDRHLTLLAINQALEPDYEVRYAWASHGSDTAGLLLLSSAEWNTLEREFGFEQVENAFMKLRTRPNIFTDSISSPGKRWWQFWK
jgi:hypothetical protein